MCRRPFNHKRYTIVIFVEECAEQTLVHGFADTLNLAQGPLVNITVMGYEQTICPGRGDVRLFFKTRRSHNLSYVILYAQKKSLPLTSANDQESDLLIANDYCLPGAINRRTYQPAYQCCTMLV